MVSTKTIVRRGLYRVKDTNNVPTPVTEKLLRVWCQKRSYGTK